MVIRLVIINFKILRVKQRAGTQTEIIKRKKKRTKKALNDKLYSYERTELFLTIAPAMRKCSLFGASQNGIFISKVKITPLRTNQHPHSNSLDSFLLISLIHQLREFVKRSKQFPFGGHFINSQNFCPQLCIDNVRRKSTLVNLETSRTNY